MRRFKGKFKNWIEWAFNPLLDHWWIKTNNGNIYFNFKFPRREVEIFLQTRIGTKDANYILAILDAREKFVAHERFQYVLLKKFSEYHLGPGRKYCWGSENIKNREINPNKRKCCIVCRECSNKFQNSNLKYNLSAQRSQPTGTPFFIVISGQNEVEEEYDVTTGAEWLDMGWISR